MFFRFAAALLLVVAVSMTQVVLEKESLRLRRLVSRQYYQTDELLELHAQLRLDIQRLTSPTQLGAEELPSSAVAHRDVRPPIENRSESIPPAASDSFRFPPRLPLLRWERPVNPGEVLP